MGRSRLKHIANFWHDDPMVRTMGFPHAFHSTPWADILQRTVREPTLSYLTPLVHSIIASPAANQLAGSLWVNQLTVAEAPVGDAPLDLLIVSAIEEGKAVNEVTRVSIVHSTVTGRNDTIDRPLDDAVALFWRFAFEKFGVQSR